ncbi:MAG TPA: alpha/beta hydrolase [Candidatus Binataceae bacterium]|nr:alpha/beta hydrolase [Candidatus Binataceae bacterium]
MSEPWEFQKLTLKSGLKMRIARAGAGNGPLIIMMHGFPECWYSWRHQLRALSDKFDCVAPEMRGYGETDAPVGTANYTLDKLVGDVADLIEALDQKHAIIVGHDWGGGVAWATALMRPDVVEKLIVMNCPHLARFGQELRRNPRQMLRSWYMLFFQIPGVPEMLLRARNYRGVTDAIRNSAIQKDAFTDADLEYYRDAFKNHYSISAALNYYRANLREGFSSKPDAASPLNRKIDAPTLLIWGEQDFALGKELTYGMEGLFTGPFTIKYIPDSGHWVQNEKPDLVNRYMRDFLESA